MARKGWKREALELHRAGLGAGSIAVRLEIELRKVLYYLVEDPRGPKDKAVRALYAAHFATTRARWGREEGTKE